MSTKEKVSLEISPISVLTVIGILVSVWLIYFLRDVLISLFIAIILMSAISPLVGLFRRKLKIGTTLAVFLAYIISLTIIGILIFTVVPPLFKQLASFLTALPQYAQSALEFMGIAQDQEQSALFKSNLLPVFSERAGQVAQGALNVTLILFSSLIETISVAVFTFYLLLEKEQVEGALVHNIPFISYDQKRKIKKAFDDIQQKLGYWARGQIALCFIIGLTTYIGLSALQVQYALPLAVIAGILEILPTIGPIMSAVPAVIVVLATDPTKAALIIILYIIIQQLENSLIVPQVMKRAIGFSPLLTILAIMIGGRLLGVAGALLAVPFTAMMFVVLDHSKSVDNSLKE